MIGNDFYCFYSMVVNKTGLCILEDRKFHKTVHEVDRYIYKNYSHLKLPKLPISYIILSQNVLGVNDAQTVIH